MKIKDPHVAREIIDILADLATIDETMPDLESIVDRCRRLVALYDAEAV